EGGKGVGGEGPVWSGGEARVRVGTPGGSRRPQAIGAIQIPPTVQAMLAARIDRLPPDEKRLLQVASVVGKDVPLGLLQSIADVPSEALRQCLDHLQAAEFV